MADEYPILYDDHLPADQPVIITEAIRRFCTFMETTQEMKYPFIHIIEGDPGAGKSVAMRYYRNSRKESRYNGLKLSIYVCLAFPTTTLSASQELMIELQEKVKERKFSPELTKIIRKHVKTNMIRSIFVDEIDRADDDVLEIFRDLLDLDDCPLYLVSSDKLSDKLKQDERYKSRRGVIFAFRNPELKEVLDDILPKLVFDRWAYDKNKEESRALGEYVWTRSLCFRNLVKNLDLANALAKKNNAPQITKEIIDNAFVALDQGEAISSLPSPQVGDKQPPSSPESNSPPSNSGRSHFETDSEKRNAAKRRKNKGKVK